MIMKNSLVHGIALFSLVLLLLAAGGGSDSGACGSGPGLSGGSGCGDGRKTLAGAN